MNLLFAAILGIGGFPSTTGRELRVRSHVKPLRNLVQDNRRCVENCVVLFVEHLFTEVERQKWCDNLNGTYDHWNMQNGKTNVISEEAFLDEASKVAGGCPVTTTTSTTTTTTTTSKFGLFLSVNLMLLFKHNYSNTKPTYANTSNNMPPGCL